MTAPLEELARQAHQWVVYADEDLVLARHGLTLGDEAPLRLIAYHAQQCAEKYPKAYLVWKGIDFPYTHNIARLLELVGTQEPCSGTDGRRQAHAVCHHSTLPQ